MCCMYYFGQREISRRLEKEKKEREQIQQDRAKLLMARLQAYTHAPVVQLVMPRQHLKKNVFWC